MGGTPLLRDMRLEANNNLPVETTEKMGTAIPVDRWVSSRWPLPERSLQSGTAEKDTGSTGESVADIESPHGVSRLNQISQRYREWFCIGFLQFDFLACKPVEVHFDYSYTREYRATVSGDASFILLSDFKRATRSGGYVSLSRGSKLSCPWLNSFVFR